MLKDKAAPPATARQTPTLAHVAAHAGVSISTAGRVLRGSSLPLSETAVQRVRASAAHLGYVPNVAARSLRGARPAVVGVIVGDIRDPYYGTIAEAITYEAEAKHGMLAIVCNMQRNPLLELKYCRQLWEHRVAGLVLTGGGFDQHLCLKDLASLVQAMNSAGLVVTTLGPRFLNAPVFSVDNVAAGAAAAEHLVKAGHRRIGIVTGHLRSETARQRYEGSLAVLRSHAARVTVRHTEFVDESVTGAIAALLGESPDVTGIIAGSDYMARIVVDWLNRHGLAVPRDMSVVGIGNTTVGSAPAVRLTTVDMHLAECASAALNCIAGADPGSAAFSPPMPRVIAGDTVTHPAAARGPAGADETGRSGSEQPIARRGGRRESGRTARLQSEAANEPTST